MKFTSSYLGTGKLDRVHQRGVQRGRFWTPGERCKIVRGHLHVGETGTFRSSGGLGSARVVLDSGVECRLNMCNLLFIESAE